MDRIPWFAAAILCAAASPLRAQPGLPQKSVPRGCAIQGLVTDADTGQPLEGAAIATVAPAAADSRRAHSDATGRFAITDASPSPLRVMVQLPGYAPARRRVACAEGQDLKGLDFALRRPPVLAGRVVGQDGRPVAGARVQAWTRRFRRGQPYFAFAGSGRSDDRGMYSVSVSTAEESEFVYVGVSAPAPGLLQGSPSRQSPRRTAPVQAQAFWPNASSIELAQPVPVHAGQRRDGLDLILTDAAGYCVVGSVSALHGAHRSVVLHQVSPGWRNALTGGAAAGAFEFCGLPPGPYEIVALGCDQPEGPGSQRAASLARARFTIADSDLDLGTLPPEAAITVPGEVALDGARHDEAVPSGIRVRFERAEGASYMGEETEAAVGPTGGFQIPRVLPGDFWLEVEGLPDGVYVKEARMGGLDVLDVPFSVTGETLTISLGLDAATLSGVVAAPGGNPAADVRVVLAREDFPASGCPLAASVLTDQNGGFRLPGLAPGAYRVAALADSLLARCQDLPGLRRALAAAEKVRLDPHGRHSIRLECQHSR